MRNATGHQGENEWPRKRMNRNAYNISSKKCLTRKFYVVVVQNNSKEMYKKVCCMGKVVFLLIGPINFFCCSCFCPCLVSHNFIFCLSI